MAFTPKINDQLVAAECKLQQQIAPILETYMAETGLQITQLDIEVDTVDMTVNKIEVTFQTVDA